MKVLATKAANPTESRAQLGIDKALTLIYAQVKLYILFLYVDSILFLMYNTSVKMSPLIHQYLRKFSGILMMIMIFKNLALSLDIHYIDSFFLT